VTDPVRNNIQKTSHLSQG